MLALWPHDLESLEAINQDHVIRELVLRMAGLARGGRLDGFIAAVRGDGELDSDTKQFVLELAGDETFLLAVEDYLYSCRHLH